MNNSSLEAAYRILLLDTKSQNPNHYICVAIEQALKAMPGIDLVIKSDIYNAASDAITNNCNLFIAFDGEELDRCICSRIAAVCGLSVLWVTEDPYELKYNISNADLFDLVFTNDSGCVEAYGEKGRHLPLAGAKPFHFIPVQDNANALRYGLFFAGTAWPNRVKLLKEVLELDQQRKSIRAKIALPTNEHLPELKLALPASQLNWRTSPLDFARFANSSVSTLVLPRVFSASDNNAFSETPPPRLYEAALAGTVQLVQSTLVEAKKYFEAEKEFLYFDTATDLFKIIAALKGDPLWRNKIARQAQAKALTHHCYEQRMAYMLEELSKLKRNFQPKAPITGTTAKKPRLLFVVHNVIENGQFGGVEVYTKQISQSLADKYEIYFYTSRFQNHRNCTAVLDNKGSVIQEHSFLNPVLPWQLSCQEREQVFASVLTKLGISLVHFHHFIGHVPSIIEIARALGVATVMTLHDHYAICHNFDLISSKGTYCHPDKISLSQCDACLLKMHKLLPESQAVRRAYWDHILAKIDTLVFNTVGGHDLTSNIYPAVAAHKNAVVLPVPVPPLQNRVLPTTPFSAPLKVAIIGNFLPHKGGDVIAQVISLMKDYNIEFHIFGFLNSEYKWLANPKVFPAVHIYGPYMPGVLPAAIHDCHVSLHLSIWPETYCLSLSEAWEFGLVPVVSDIGALGERVTDGVNGLKIPPNAEGAVVQALYRLAETPGLLETLRKNIGAAPIARTEEHLIGLCSIYHQLIARRVINKGELSTISLQKLNRRVPSNWGTPLNVDNQLSIFSYLFRMRHKLVNLMVRSIRHLRTYGLASAIRVSMRYIKRRL